MRDLGFFYFFFPNFSEYKVSHTYCQESESLFVFITNVAVLYRSALYQK